MEAKRPNLRPKKSDGLTRLKKLDPERDSRVSAFIAAIHIETKEEGSCILIRLCEGVCVLCVCACFALCDPNSFR